MALEPPRSTELTLVPVAIIEDVVARDYDRSRADLIAHRREAVADEARQVVQWLALKLTTLSLPRLGKFVERDHSTVYHNARKVTARMEREPEFAARVMRLMNDAIAFANSPAAREPKTVDPIAAAERVALAGARQAIGLSTLEVVAVCVRMVELEDLAAATAQFLVVNNAITAAGLMAADPAALTRRAELLSTLAVALDALGYQPEPEHDQEETRTQDQAAEAGAAAAAPV